MTRFSKSDSLEKFLRDRYRLLKRFQRLSCLLAGLGASSLVLILMLLLEQYLYLSPFFKSFLWIFLGVSGILAAFETGRRTRFDGFTAFYRSISEKIGLPALRHLMDLAKSQSLRGGSDQWTEGQKILLDAAIRQNLEEINRSRPHDKIRSSLKNHPVMIFFRRITASSILSLFLLGAVALIYPDSLYRNVTFWTSYERPVPFVFHIVPGDTIIEQGSVFQVGVYFRGSIPDQVRLGLQSELERQPRIQGMTRLDGQRVSERLFSGHPDAGDSPADAVFLSRETELYEDAVFFVEMDGYRTPLYHVRVELLPRLRELTVTAHPPSYTGLSSLRQTYPFNRMEVPLGSELEIQSAVNKPLSMIRLLAEEQGDTLFLTADSLVSVRFQVKNDERYHFEMRDHHGLSNSNPFRFRIVAKEDLPPRIDILSPEPFLSGHYGDILPLLYDFEDDYGITDITLHYELQKAFVAAPQRGSVSLRVPPRLSGLDEFDWDISDLGLGPMDRLSYWITITDNNEISGYQTSRSSTHILEIPSLAARLYEQEEKEEEIGQRFTELEDQYRQMQEEMKRLRESIQTRPDEDWEQSELIDEISEQRQRIEEQLKELQREFEELTDDLSQQGVMSEETLARYQELQELIREIDDPEIMRLLEEMQKNLGELDQSELRRLLEDIEFSEERYRERLERTLELFKYLRHNADLDKMSRLLEDMRDREEALSLMQEFGEEEVRQQEQIREQLKDLSEKMDQLPDRSPERRQDQVRQLRDDMMQRFEDLDERLQENILQMMDESSDTPKLQQEQQDMSQEMGRMAEELSDMRMQMMQQTISVNMDALRQILETMLLLSQEQKDVALRTADLPAGSPGFIEQARRQRNINQQFSMLTDSLYRVSSEIPQFSNRINDRKRDIQRHMDRAVRYLIDRQRSEATAEERISLGGLNEIGTMIADLLDQLSQMENGDGGGQMSLQQMMEQMQGLSQDQQQLNQQIQDFINDLQGERLTRDHMERLDQMARQQNQIREQMRELQRRGGQSGDRLLSEMEQMIQQMEEAINDLRGGSTDELMVHRQQNILSRMLEAEESIHKRDEDEERRLGETAEDYDPSRASELTMEELRQRIRDGVEQSHYTPFRSEYRHLIERYFQLMEEYLEGRPITP